MDGLSAAASGIVVVSLAIQLVDSVREIRRFFRTLKDAPEELGRLLDLLEHMELMLEHIGKLVYQDSDISPSVLKAIQTCGNALKKLDALTQKVKRNPSTQSPLKRSLGFFRLACKQEEVEEIENQLDRAVNNLNMVMTALNLHGIQRLWSGVSATNAATATITEMVLRIEVAANQRVSKQKLIVGNSSRTSRSTVCRRSATHKVVYRGFLGSITARIQSQSEDSVERDHSKQSYARDEWSWVFIPSFLSRCVQVQCASYLGSVERTLRTCPILPDDHPAWDMCRRGEVTSIQELFSTREISPYAINKSGETLLHVATGLYHSQICTLLLEMGVGAEVVDAYGNSPPTGWIIFGGSTETCSEIEITYRLFSAVNEDRNLAEFSEGYFQHLEDLPVEGFRSQVEKWVTEQNVNLFSPSRMQIVTRRLCNLSIDTIELRKWKDIAFYLVAKKAKLCELSSLSRKTCLLEVAVTSVAHPFDAQAIGTRLLEIFDASNVDLVEYLTFERQHHRDGLLAPRAPLSFIDEETLRLNWPDPRAIKLHIYEEQAFSFSWDWWVDPKATAFMVCHEFRYFGRAEHLLRDERGLPRWLVYWPFIYPDWDLEVDDWYHESALLKRFQRRFEHRWQKKMIKQAKIQGTYKKPKMPGTWID